MDELKPGVVTWDHPTLPSVEPYAYTMVHRDSANNEVVLERPLFEIQSYFWYGAVVAGLIVLVIALFFMMRKKPGQ